MQGDRRLAFASNSAFEMGPDAEFEAEESPRGRPD